MGTTALPGCRSRREQRGDHRHLVGAATQVGQGSEGDRAAARLDHLLQRLPDHGQVRDALLHLDQLHAGALGQAVTAVTAPGRLQQVADTSSSVNPSRCAALITRSTVTASAGYRRCPPSVRSGSAGRPRRS